jgi:OmpA-OmpF porin, OOP family
MFKKIIASTLVTVSALSMAAAHAASDGIYVTGQLGYANTHMKNKITFDPGSVPAGFEIPNGGAASRFAIGYQFNQNLAMELGYLQLHNQTGTIPVGSGWLPGTEKLKEDAIDIAAKGILPITDKFNLYGKTGIAYLTSTITSNFSGTTGNQNDFFNIAKHKWAPEAALGVSYDITPNVSVDTSWTHIQPLGNKRPGNIDFIAVGVGYNFG